MDRIALVCRNIWENPRITQRELAQMMDISLGTANGLIRQCMERELLKAPDADTLTVTPKGMELLEPYRVDGAVIIAAGFGSRFVPLTFETPKGLLEVYGERMIERQIRQLHERGITDITIVVGYLKEKFEYLMDKFQVKLLYNREYASKNTLTTIYHARKILRGKNMYLLSSDNWLRNNMFHTYECGAWYSASYMEGDTSEWCLSFNKKGKIQSVDIGGHDSWVMYGPAYFSREWSEAVLPVLEAYYHLPGTEQFYWEHVYMELVNKTAHRRLTDPALLRACAQASEDAPFAPSYDMDINRQPKDQVYEFENLEELRQFDARYQNHSDNEALELISKVFQVEESQIQGIRCLKSGMTNQSFLFQVQGESYICRIPGAVNSMLINRTQEAQVFETVKALGISEQVLYFDGETGYKISKYYEGSHNSDPRDWDEVAQCMKLLNGLHHSDLSVDHDFDIRERIGFYENLCQTHGGIPFEDYSAVRKQMTELMDWLDGLGRPKVLSHIDSVADNFLFLPDGSLKLIDWEYAGMCDPLIDVAMCAIYSYYDEEEADRLIQLYLERQPSQEECHVVYAYMALGGFLWALWAVYKSALGVEFGEYTIYMYRYAKTYYRKIFCKL